MDNNDDRRYVSWGNLVNIHDCDYVTKFPHGSTCVVLRALNKHSGMTQRPGKCSFSHINFQWTNVTAPTKEMHTGFLWENLNQRDHLEDVSSRREKKNKMDLLYIWICIEASGEFLCTRWRTFGLHKTQEIYWLSQKQLHNQEGSWLQNFSQLVKMRTHSCKFTSATQTFRCVRAPHISIIIPNRWSHTQTFPCVRAPHISIIPNRWSHTQTFRCVRAVLGEEPVPVPLCPPQIQV
jgi:hypothetical protein